MLPKPWSSVEGTTISLATQRFEHNNADLLLYSRLFAFRDGIQMATFDSVIATCYNAIDIHLALFYEHEAVSLLYQNRCKEN